MGLATKMEEYVPTTIPTSIANAKSWMTFPPRKNKASSTNRVVEDVRTVLLKVSFMLLFIVAGNDCFFFDFLRFSLILSNTIMVSFKEYPTMVSRAATIAREISFWVRRNAPMVIVTSWIRAIMAPRAYLNLKYQQSPMTNIMAIMMSHVTLAPKEDAV